jgi:hypothetical protein
MSGANLKPGVANVSQRRPQPSPATTGNEEEVQVHHLISVDTVSRGGSWCNQGRTGSLNICIKRSYTPTTNERDDRHAFRLSQVEH